MNVTIPALNFKSNNPAKVGRTLAMVDALRREGVAIDSVRQLRAKVGEFVAVCGSGPVYWTLAARLLGAK